MNNISYKQALKNAIAEEMSRDPNVIVIGEDIGLYGGKFGVTKGLIEEFGAARVVETPISETAFTGAAVGASFLGLRPIVDIMFGDFTTLASDPIINHAAKYHFMSGGQTTAPIVVRTTFGCGTGAAAQHSQSLESMFLNTPGLKIVAPATPYDAKGLLKSAVRDDAPVLFFEHKLLYKLTGDVPDGEYTVPIGKANVLKKGRCISLISYSYCTQLCLLAANELEKEGIDAEVIDLRSLKPLDNDTILNSCEKTRRAVIVHEAPVFGGFGGEIAAMINESGTARRMLAPVKRLGGLEIPVPFSRPLEAQILPCAGHIVEAAKALMQQ